MASNDSTSDDDVPVIRIEDVDIVDLASLLDDTPTGGDKKQTPSGTASMLSEANRAAADALAMSVDDDSAPGVPTLGNATHEVADVASPTGGNVFNVDLDGLDDFEALLQRTMGEAAGTVSQPAPDSPPAPTVNVPAPGEETPRQKAAKAVASTKWRKPQRPKAPEKSRDEPSGESKAIEDLRKKVKAMNDETESYRRRLKEEAKAARGKGREDAFKTLMPIMDALEMALKSANDTTDTEQLIEGIALVLKRLVTDLGQLGLEIIDPAGELFDPNMHEAFQQVVTGTVAPGHVCEVVRTGYRFEERLLRPAQVLVEKG